jgi:hypothetical protein
MQISFAKINNTELKFQFGMATERERERTFVPQSQRNLNASERNLCACQH